jgi:hypothetical protein
LTQLAMNFDFHMSPVFGQLQLRNCPKTGDDKRQTRPTSSVPPITAYVAGGAGKMMQVVVAWA